MWRIRNSQYLGLRLAAVLFPIALCGAGPAVARPDVTPAPAMWEVDHGNARVFLFGSVHALRPHTPWLAPAIAKAMESADEFYFELRLDRLTRMQIREFVGAHGLLPRGGSLRALLSRSGQIDYDAAMKSLHLNRARVDRLRPWFASMIVTDAIAHRSRYRSRSGADIEIETFARTHGRPMRFFETGAQQLQFLANAEPAAAIRLLEADLANLDENADAMDALVDAWLAGDVARLGALIDDGTGNAPAAKVALFDNRDRAWMPQIERLLATDRTVFITVGAGHLVGRGSVIDLLCARGYAVRPIRTGAVVPPPACPAGARAVPGHAR